MACDESSKPKKNKRGRRGIIEKGRLGEGSQEGARGKNQASRALGQQRVKKNVKKGVTGAIQGSGEKTV